MDDEGPWPDIDTECVNGRPESGDGVAVVGFVLRRCIPGRGDPGDDEVGDSLNMPEKMASVGGARRR
jgi:hypothetical protein